MTRLRKQSWTGSILSVAYGLKIASPTMCNVGCAFWHFKCYWWFSARFSVWPTVVLNLHKLYCLLFLFVFILIHCNSNYLNVNLTQWPEYNIVNQIDICNHILIECLLPSIIWNKWILFKVTSEAFPAMFVATKKVTYSLNMLFPCPQPKCFVPKPR